MTHGQRVLKYLDDFGSITTLDAFNDLGNTRLAVTIHNLRKQGYNIRSTTEKRKNRYGEDTHYSRYYFKGSEFEKLLNKGEI